MMQALPPSVIQKRLRIPLQVVAELAGVDRKTLSMFLIGPEFVKDDTRERCERVYELLRDVLKGAPSRAK